MLVAALRCTNMMMRIRSCSDILSLSLLRYQLMMEAANARLAPFYMSYLLDNVSAVCSTVPSLGTAMFEFALQISELTSFHQLSMTLTMAVLYESVVPSCRIIFTKSSSEWYL